MSSATASAANSTENFAATGPPYSAAASVYNEQWPRPEESVWVYVTIQLYSIEKDFYLVDFKCAGYERLVKRFAQELNGSNHSDLVRVDHAPEEYNEGDGTEDEDGEEWIGAGRTEDKDISSPYPFLDVASRLIIQLAEANE